MRVLYHNWTGISCDVSAIRGKFRFCGSDLGKVKSLATERTEVHRGTPQIVALEENACPDKSNRIPLWFYSVELCVLCGYAFLL